MNGIIPLEDFVKKNNLIGQYRRISSSYKDRELFKGILTEEVLKQFTGYRMVCDEEYQWSDGTLNLEVKPIKLTKYIVTVENKQPLNSKVNYLICNVPDLRDVNRIVERYHNYIWQYKNFEIYENDLEHFVDVIPKGLSRKSTRSERNKARHNKNQYKKMVVTATYEELLESWEKYLEEHPLCL